MINLYEYDSDNSTGKWTSSQWSWLICGFTGASLFLLSGPLTHWMESISVDGVNKLGVVLMIIGFGCFTSARSGFLLEKFDRRARKRTRSESYPERWKGDDVTDGVAAGSPSPR